MVSKLDPFVVKTEPVVISDEDNDDGYGVESKASSTVLSSGVTSGVVAAIANVPRLTYHPRPLAVSICTAVQDTHVSTSLFMINCNMQPSLLAWRFVVMIAC